MNIRLYHARILTMRENDPMFEGEVWIKGNRIIYVGSAQIPDKLYEEQGLNPIIWDREIDCEGNVLMPGFKNAHAHSAMTAFRSLADDLNLQDWLNTMIFPREANMTGEDCYILTKLAILEYLTSGITAIGDMYLTPETIADACIDMGMRGVLVSGLNQFGPTLSVMEERYKKLNHYHELIHFKMGVHAEYTCPKELLESVSSLIHTYQAPLYTHMSETKTEVEECRQRYAMSPPELFEKLGLFDFGGCIYHGVHVSEADMDIFKKRNIFVVTNPSSNAKLASGIAPVSAYLKKGISLSIGTDGASSNNCLDMFREMFLVSYLAKLKEEDPKAVDANEVLKMATRNGAVSMGLTECDVLEKNKLADIVMIDLHQPNMQPLHNISKNIVYSGSKTNVKMTMINGKILYENGIFFCQDQVEEIYRKSNEIKDRLK